MNEFLKELQDETVAELREQATAYQESSQRMYDNAGRVRESYNNKRTYLAERGYILQSNAATQSYLSSTQAAVRYSGRAKACAKLADDIELLYKGM